MLVMQPSTVVYAKYIASERLFDAMVLKSTSLLMMNQLFSTATVPAIAPCSLKRQPLKNQKTEFLSVLNTAG
jgi:hypothetical protein